jgi:hypothetical protein
MAAMLAGCAWTVPEPVLVREPRPEPVPLRIGVHYPADLRGFHYRHHFSDTAYVLGTPSVRLLGEALGLLFVEVVESLRPAAGVALGDGVAGVIEPRITSAGFQYPPAGITYFPTHVTAVLTRRGDGSHLERDRAGQRAHRESARARRDDQAELRAGHAGGRLEAHERVPRGARGASLARRAGRPLTIQMTWPAVDGPASPNLEVASDGSIPLGPAATEEGIMEEVFPVGSGVVLGLVIAYLVSGRLRGWVLAVGSVLIGATAAWVTGELAVSWLYLLVDIGQVLVAGALTWILAVRWRRFVGAARREA